MLKLQNVSITAVNDINFVLVSTNEIEEIAVSHTGLKRGQYSAFLIETTEDYTSEICAYMEQKSEEWVVSRIIVENKICFLIEVF